MYSFEKTGAEARRIDLCCRVKSSMLSVSASRRLRVEQVAACGGKADELLPTLLICDGGVLAVHNGADAIEALSCEFTLIPMLKKMKSRCLSRRVRVTGFSCQGQDANET